MIETKIKIVCNKCGETLITFSKLENSFINMDAAMIALAAKYPQIRLEEIQIDQEAVDGIH